MHEASPRSPFAKLELYELLETEGIGYAIRLPASPVLQERIGHLLTRPVGRRRRGGRLGASAFPWSNPARQRERPQQPVHHNADRHDPEQIGIAPAPGQVAHADHEG
jgi:hypothetical protein